MHQGCCTLEAATAIMAETQRSVQDINSGSYIWTTSSITPLSVVIDIHRHRHQGFKLGDVRHNGNGFRPPLSINLHHLPPPPRHQPQHLQCCRRYGFANNSPRTILPTRRPSRQQRPRQQTSAGGGDYRQDGEALQNPSPLYVGEHVKT